MDYHKAIDLNFEGKKSEIELLFDKELIEKAYSHVKEAKSLWLSAMKVIKDYEKEIKISHKLNEGVKLYALDGILLSEGLKITKAQRRTGLQLFCIYYLCVHLYDDIVEDPQKFYSKFKYDEKLPLDLQKNATGISFIMQSIRSTIKLLSADKKISLRESDKILKEFIDSLSNQTKYFVAEQVKNLEPETVLKIKEREVSGESTAFLFDCLRLHHRYGKRSGKYLRKAFKYLGSLTQFTDDIRDYDKDKKTKNANLLISLEKETGSFKKAKLKFVDMYNNEENNMIRNLRKSKVQTDIEILKLIPWHPFFMKYLAK